MALLQRRTFLFVAPAIIAAPSLMRVSSLHQRVMWEYTSEQAYVEYYPDIQFAATGLILATPQEIKHYFGPNRDVRYWRA